MSIDPNRTPSVNERDGILDEVQAWYVGKADREGLVYTAVVRQLMNKIYRDRDYLRKRASQGRNTGYDFSVERDLMALAWTVRTLIRYVPVEVKQLPEPPLKPRKYRKRLTPRERTQTYGQPMRDWDGPDLPPRNKGEPPPND